MIISGDIVTEIELIRSTQGEKGQQIEIVRRWQESRTALAPKSETRPVHQAVAEDEARAVHDVHGLAYMQKTARDRRNVFAVLMEGVKTHSLGQINARGTRPIKRRGTIDGSAN